MDVEAVAIFLARPCGETGRTFVIGIFDSQNGFGEDLFHVASPAPDLAGLRQMIGVGEII